MLLALRKKESTAADPQHFRLWALVWMFQRMSKTHPYIFFSKKLDPTPKTLPTIISCLATSISTSSTVNSQLCGVKQGSIMVRVFLNCVDGYAGRAVGKVSRKTGGCYTLDMFWQLLVIITVHLQAFLYVQSLNNQASESYCLPDRAQ